MLRKHVLQSQWKLNIVLQVLPHSRSGYQQMHNGKGWMRTELGPLCRALHVIPGNFYYNPSFSSWRKVVPWEQEFSPEQSFLPAPDIWECRKEAIGTSCCLEKERASSPGWKVPLHLLWSCTQYNAWQLSTHQWSNRAKILQVLLCAVQSVSPWSLTEQ